VSSILLPRPEDIVDRQLGPADRRWAEEAIAELASEYQRSADTHLLRIVLQRPKPITIYLKDESTHPTGSLKHRLARSLFLFGLCNGHIRKDMPIVEASSGSTAISEAYFARLLNLPFIAVVPHGIAHTKVEQIEFFGGECRRVTHDNVYEDARAFAARVGGHYMDQFTFAERATDWRGNNNIAESLFAQLEREETKAPDWIVVGAGTGGTSATIGRYIRYRPNGLSGTRLCVVDPENSVFFDYFRTGNAGIRSDKPSRIEGIGRPRVEMSFIPSVIDAMIRTPDAASIAGLRWLERKIGRRCGASTGANIFAALQLAAQSRREDRAEVVATLICDGGDRYSATVYNPDWIAAEHLDPAPYEDALEAFG
jgi:cysteine synthase A